MTKDEIIAQVDHFLFHLDSADRVAPFSERQRRTLLGVLDFLVMNTAEALATIAPLTFCSGQGRNSNNPQGGK
jgi:hypothetical protein